MGRPVSVEDIFTEVDRVLEGAPATSWVAAFDADGTLWSGDLGEEAFEAAPAAGMIDLEGLREPLEGWAARYHLEVSGSVDEVVARLQQALYSGALVERGAHHLGQDRNATLTDVYGLHAWCYAGRTVDEVRAFGERVYAASIASGVFAHTRPLLDGFRARGVRVMVVSASPRPLIEAACAHFDIALDDVVAMRPAEDDRGRILPRLADAVYGPGKVRYLERAMGEAHLLAALGDSVEGGDKELLERAVLAIGVATRGAHREAALRHERMLLLDP